MASQEKGFGQPYPAQGYPPQGYPPQQYGYPPQGYPPQQQAYQQGPVMAPPAYQQQAPSRRGFLEGCLAALCCCCILDECCCDPSIIFMN